MHTVNAEPRDFTTNPRMLRRNGFIPGNIYGKSLHKSISVQIPAKEVEILAKTLAPGNSLSVNVGGERHMCLFREITYTPGTANIEHVSFQALVAGEAVTNRAQIVLLNRDSVNGIVLSRLSELSYKALPKDLIGNIEIDLSGFKVGDQMSVANLPETKNKALEILTPPDTIIFTVAEAKVNIVEETAETEEAAKEESGDTKEQ